jgi:hypothetical protein
MPLTLLDEVPPAGSVPGLGLLRIHRHEGHATSPRIHNLKELRPRVGGTSEVRLLFVFAADHGGKTRSQVLQLAIDRLAS